MSSSLISELEAEFGQSSLAVLGVYNTQDLVGLAGVELAIDLDDPRFLNANVDLDTFTPERVHNNFFQRFVEIQAEREGLATLDQSIRLRMIKERFGLDLVSLYNGRSDLYESIFRALEAKRPYDVLVSACSRLALIESVEGVQQNLEIVRSDLHAATGHKLGIHAIGQRRWDSLNPLLEEAYAYIDMHTLNAPYLTR